MMSATRPVVFGAFLLSILVCVPVIARAELFFTAPRAFEGSILSASGNFTADQYRDVVSAKIDRITISKGNADGTFSEPTAIFVCAGFVYSNAFQTPASGDFNGDGKTDVAVFITDRFCANQPSESLAVFLGNGNGTFAAPVFTVFSASSIRPTVFQTADMNGDGRTDLILSTAFSVTSGDHVGVYLSNTSGGFLDPPSVMNVGGQAFYWPAIGDVNNDGRPDVMVVRRSPGDIVLMLNNGSGALGSPQIISVFFAYRGNIVIGQFTGDSNLDFAVVKDDINPQQLQVWQGNGSGGFTASALRFSTIYRLQSADFNADGHADILGQASGRIFIAKGNGSGGFSPADLYAIGSGWTEPADFDGDGRLDVATNQSMVLPYDSPSGVSDEFSILYGGPGGTLRTSPSLILPFGGDEVSIADLTNDGLVDFAITGDSFQGEFYTLIQTAGSKFEQPPSTRISGRPEGITFSPMAIATGKLDADNLLDVVVAGTRDNSGSPANVLLARNTGGGNFAFMGEMSLGGQIRKVVATDVNNDNTVDLLFAQLYNSGPAPWAGFMVAMGIGNGTYAAPVSYLQSMNAVGLAAGDLTGDNRPDVAVALSNSKVEIFTNNGSGDFTSIGSYTLPGWADDVKLADVNGDGLRDLIVAHSTNMVAVYLGTGNGAFGASAQYSTAGRLRQKLTVGDLNGDGRFDVATSNNTVVTAFESNSAGQLAAKKKWMTSAGLLSITTADIDGNGKADLVTTSSIDSFKALSFMLNFAVPTLVPRQSAFDFDGDGKTDIGIFRPSGGEWWVNRSGNGQTFALQFGAATDKITPADYTGDGKADIAFFRPPSGQWYVLRSEDNSFFALPFGSNGDVPVPADYDADGTADFAVFRPSNSTWYISQSTGAPTRIEQFGVSGDQPVVADYDGDARADVAILRNAGGVGQWWIKRSTAGVHAMQLGSWTDIAVQGDYTGDGKADVAIWRPSSGEWFIVRSQDSSFYAFPFGANGDVIAPGDYDGDGKFDPTVFRPSSATWFIARSSAGTQIVQFGANGDRPLPNAFVP
jgi:hypothetical protein